MLSIENNNKNYNAFMVELQEKLSQQVVQEVEAKLEAEVTQWLQRGPYEKRAKLGWRQNTAECQLYVVRFFGTKDP